MATNGHGEVGFRGGDDVMAGYAWAFSSEFHRSGKARGQIGVCSLCSRAINIYLHTDITHKYNLRPECSAVQSDFPDT